MTGRMIGNPPVLKDPVPRSYSHAYRVDGPASIIVLAGQNSQAADGSVRFPNDIEGQTRATFESIAAALESVGASPRDIIDLTAYLLDVENHAWVYRRVRAEFFGSDTPFPASTLLEVPKLSVYGTLIEVRALAVVSSH